MLTEALKATVAIFFLFSMHSLVFAKDIEVKQPLILTGCGEGQNVANESIVRLNLAQAHLKLSESYQGKCEKALAFADALVGIFNKNRQGLDQPSEVVTTFSVAVDSGEQYSGVFIAPARYRDQIPYAAIEVANRMAYTFGFRRKSKIPYNIESTPTDANALKVLKRMAEGSCSNTCGAFCGGESMCAGFDPFAVGGDGRGACCCNCGGGGASAGDAACAWACLACAVGAAAAGSAPPGAVAVGGVCAGCTACAFDWLSPW